MFKRLALAAFSAFTAFSTPAEAKNKTEAPAYHQVDNSESPCDTAIHTFRDGTQARAVECMDQHEFNSGAHEQTRDEFLSLVDSVGPDLDENEAQELQKAMDAMDPMTFALIQDSIAYHAPRYGFDPADIDPEVIFAIGIAESRLAKANKNGNAESWTGCQGWGQFTQSSWKSNLVLNADRIDTLTGPNTPEWLGKLTTNRKRAKVDTGMLTRGEKHDMLDARNIDALNIDATVELNLRNARALKLTRITPDEAPKLYWMHSEGPSYTALKAHIDNPSFKTLMGLAKFQRDNVGYASLQDRYDKLRSAGLGIKRISKHLQESGGLPKTLTLMPQAEIKERELDDLRDYVAEEVAKLQIQEIKDRQLVIVLDEQKEEESIQGPGKSLSDEPMRDSLQRGPVRTALHGITVFKNTPTHKKFNSSADALNPVLELAQKDGSFHRVANMNFQVTTLSEYIGELRNLSAQGMDKEFEDQLDDFEALTAHLSMIGVKKSEIWTGPKNIDYSWVASVIDKFSANTVEMPDADDLDMDDDVVELKMPAPEVIEMPSGPVDIVIPQEEETLADVQIPIDTHPRMSVAVVEEYDDEDEDEDDISGSEMAAYEVTPVEVEEVPDRFFQDTLPSVAKKGFSKLKSAGKKLFSRWF